MQVLDVRRQSWMNMNDHFITVMQDPWYKALVELQDAITRSTSRFFSAQGLRTIHLPITTHSISSPMGLGSDSLPVKIDLFGVDTYLADSMQFMLEYGCRLNHVGAYYLMPSFRGESADETHLCQFYHSEAEIVGSIDDVMGLVEQYVQTMTSDIMAECGATVARFAKSTAHIDQLLNLKRPFPRITLDAAVELLNADPALVKHCEPGYRVLTRRGEQALIEHFGGFVWLTEQDHLAVPFYQAFADQEQRKAKASDLLFGLGEVVGSGERHATAAEVYAALEFHNVDAAAYDWYCKMRELQPLQTAGFGLGIERYICWLVTHNDVRDCQILPRFNGMVTIP